MCSSEDELDLNSSLSCRGFAGARRELAQPIVMIPAIAEDDKAGDEDKDGDFFDAIHGSKLRGWGRRMG